MTDEQYTDILNGKNSIGLLINQYIIIKLSDGIERECLRWDGNNFKRIKDHSNSIGNKYIGKIVPLNNHQRIMFDLIQNDDIPVKLVTGIAGSGKTYVALAYALSQILSNQSKYDQIVMIRNNFEVKNTKSLGALPGDADQKLRPFIMPLADILGSEMELDQLIESECIKIVHLGYIRGRNFSNSIMVVDEAENLSSEHVALLISRVGKNSIIIFLGDTNQVDSLIFENDSGIKKMQQCLKNNKLFGAVDLIKTERSQVAELSILIK